MRARQRTLPRVGGTRRSGQFGVGSQLASGIRAFFGSGADHWRPGARADGAMAVAAQCVRQSLWASISHGPQLTSGGWNPGLGKLREAPRLREADSRGAWFRWRAISEQHHAEGTAAGPCRLDSGRVGDRSKESRYEGPISVRRGPLATGVAEIQGSGWLAETASGDGVSAACVAGVEEAALSGVAASPEFASGSVWGTATVFGVDGGTVDLSEN